MRHFFLVDLTCVKSTLQCNERKQLLRLSLNTYPATVHHSILAMCCVLSKRKDYTKCFIPSEEPFWACWHCPMWLGVICTQLETCPGSINLTSGYRMRVQCQYCSGSRGGSVSGVAIPTPNHSSALKSCMLSSLASHSPHFCRSVAVEV